MRAVLKKPALLSILCAAVETFKKECFLILLGHQRKNDFVIENAVPLQTAKRKFTGVETAAKKIKLVLTLSEFFCKNSQPIGDCHSHTERKSHTSDSKYPVNPSPIDIENSKQNQIYMIIGVSQKKRSQKWQRKKKYSIVGTLRDYRFEIKTYWAPENTKLEQITLICPSAYHLNAFKK